MKGGKWRRRVLRDERFAAGRLHALMREQLARPEGQIAIATLLRRPAGLPVTSEGPIARWEGPFPPPGRDGQRSDISTARGRVPSMCSRRILIDTVRGTARTNPTTPHSQPQKASASSISSGLV